MGVMIQGDQGIATHLSRPTFDTDGNYDIHEIDYLRSLAMVMLAGKLAEEGFQELYGHPIEAQLDAHDKRDIAYLLSDLFEDDELSAQSWLRECEAEADRLVVQNFSRIEALAVALLSQKSIPGELARKIIQGD